MIQVSAVTVRTLDLPTLDSTLRFGAKLGERLRAGDLVLLSGSLGAGKTALVKGIAAGMGVVGRITSPTFVVARVHPAGAGQVGLVHVDAYRLSGSPELDDLDLDTDLTACAVVVEWGEGLAEQLSTTRLEIALRRLPDDRRVATVTAVGDDWVARASTLSGS
jgi:tRNA threonylcarbamoyladenosine biosynthesis protein TsaE